MFVCELRQASQQQAKAAKYQNELIRKVTESPSRKGFIPDGG
jgi:hypothetical protein